MFGLGRSCAIVNPVAAGGAARKLLPRLEQEVGRRLKDIEIRLTGGPGQATEMAREALRSGFGSIIAVGGDGLISEVANGFFDGDAPVAPEAALAVIPVGTGGDFRRTLGLEKDPLQVLDLFQTAKPQPCDVGRLTCVGADGAALTRYFINIASFGLSGVVDRLVNRSSKALGGRVTFAACTLQALASHRAYPISLAVDDRPARELRISTVAVANGRYFGGGMMVAPKAQTDDGLLDVVVIGELGLLDFLVHGGKLYKGTHLSMRQVELLRGRRIEARPLDPDRPPPLDVDGETPGTLPSTFEVLPGAIRVIGRA